jgi:hypothetical protein
MFVGLQLLLVATAITMMLAPLVQASVDKTSTPIETNNPTETKIIVLLGNSSVSAVIDTHSEASIITSSLTAYIRCRPKRVTNAFPLSYGRSATANGLCHAKISASGAEVEVQLWVSEDTPHLLLLGQDFIKQIGTRAVYPASQLRDTLPWVQNSAKFILSMFKVVCAIGDRIQDVLL